MGVVRWNARDLTTGGRTSLRSDRRKAFLIGLPLSSALILIWSRPRPGAAVRTMEDCSARCPSFHLTAPWCRFVQASRWHVHPLWQPLTYTLEAALIHCVPHTEARPGLTFVTDIRATVLGLITSERQT